MMNSVARQAGVALVLAASVASVGPVAASAPAAPAWDTALIIPGSQSSVEDLTRAPGGSVVWAIGGRSSPTVYDAPTVWRYDGSDWKTQRIPLDLTGRWGYLQNIAAVSDTDAWAVGYTTISATGSPRPFVAHLINRRWTVVDEAWTAPGSDGVMLAVTARAADDVWVFGHEENPDIAMAWHFNGHVWSKQAITIQNRRCYVPQDSTVTDAIATADGLYVASFCTSKTTKLAATVSFFDGRRWRTELSGIDGSLVRGLGADPSGQVWAAGSEVGSSGGHAQAWYGQAGPFTSLGLDGPQFSALTDVSATDDMIAFSGEVSGGPHGPQPYLLTGTPGNLQEVSVPYDRYLSGVLLDPDGRLWVCGPTFGGWLGGDKPHARILTREPVVG
jgi:hypothetical protein